MQHFTAPPDDDDGLIYGEPYDPSNPSHRATVDMREKMRQIYQERDAAIAKICLFYKVSLEEAAQIYNFQSHVESERHAPRKPQALIEWEENQRLASMNQSFRPSSGGFHPKKKPDPWDRTRN